jgi:Excalibur calcium-binding domain
MLAGPPYANCTEAHKDRRYNIPRGDPAYQQKLDRDNDGIALSTMPVLGVDASLLRVARMARMVHLMRHASHLRLSRLLVPVTRLGQFKRSAAGMMTDLERAGR